MSISYRANVATVFEILAEGLAPFVDARMSSAYPDHDWILMAAAKLGKRRDVVVSLSDPHFQLEVVNRWWGPVFAGRLNGDARQTVTDLRTARNHWAHPDEDHPFDYDYAAKVHRDAEELLRTIDAPEAERIAELLVDLRWDSVRGEARERGVSEVDALMDQLVDLQKQHEELRAQLDDARRTASSAAGRQRAVARQLAELQTQYASVVGLRDEYDALRRQLQEEEVKRGADRGDATPVREQLDHATSALDTLHDESESLRAQLAQARAAMSNLDLASTPTGRRWIWLVTGLLVVLAVLVAIMATI
jgi:seryl-tRNA synthetase